MSKFSEGWRAAGFLLHPSSLPSAYGIGDLGPEAHRLAGFLKKAGFHFWQMLPLNPSSPAFGNSPYSAFSAFAGNPLLISPELMVRDGWLNPDEAAGAEQSRGAKVDFERAVMVKEALLDLAFERWERKLTDFGPFIDFAWSQGAWLNDYAFFMAAKSRFGGHGWLAWPEDLKRRDDAALHKYGTELARPILREKFAQFLFFHQLAEFKEVLNRDGLGLIGDAAIYVNHDGSDVWANQHLFCLDAEGRPTEVAGVPPDYFAATGQLWGNPLFNWPRHEADGFTWWKSRLWYNLGLYDWVRLDHFRAFAAYWAVPAGAPTAAEGQWRRGPGERLFQAASDGRHLGIIAEDLGVITPDVTRLRRAFDYPGMRVLQFGFGPDVGCSTHAPFRIEPDNVVFSATHDNNTTRGWFRQEATALERKQISEMAGFEVYEETAPWALIRLAWFSPGALAVTTAQDLLSLDERARLNVPGTAEGNWGWRLKSLEPFTARLADQMAELGALSGRDNCEHPNTLDYPPTGG